MSHIYGTKKSLAEQWKQIYTKRVPKRGTSELFRNILDTGLQAAKYDRNGFAEGVLGSLSDIDRFIKGIEDNRKRLQDQIDKYKEWSPKEADFFKQLLKDLHDEHEFWKQQRKVFVLTRAGVAEAHTKLDKTHQACVAALAKLKTSSDAIRQSYDKLVAADKMRDHKATPLQLQALRKVLGDLQTAWDDAHVRHAKRKNSAIEASKAHVNATDAQALLTLAAGILKDWDGVERELGQLQTEIKTWNRWVSEQLGNT